MSKKSESVKLEFRPGIFDSAQDTDEMGRGGHLLPIM